MSNHAAYIYRVSNIEEHENADRLEIVRLKGLSYQIVAQKSVHNPGDEVLFIQYDISVPEELIEYFDLSFLKGSGNKVRPVRLRGEMSYGIILPVAELCEYSSDFAELYAQEGESEERIDYSDVLGLYRQIPAEQGEQAGSLPADVDRYSLENIERYPGLLDALNDRGTVIITEKLEGTNFAVHYDSTLPEGEQFAFCSRNHQKRNGMYLDVPQAEGLAEICKRISQDLDFDTVTLRGEIVGPGIQGNIYNLDKKQCYVFDMMLDGRYGFYDLITASAMYNIKMPHVVSIVPGSEVTLEYLSKIVSGSLQGVTGGMRSYVPGSDTLAEGIVVQGLDNAGNRVVFKYRSPDYLVQ